MGLLANVSECAFYDKRITIRRLNPFPSFLQRGFNSSWFYLIQFILILRPIRTFAIKNLWQHRTIWQEHSAKDFASYESYKRAGILYVFPPFITARMGQKIGRRPQTQLCGDALSK